MLLFSYEIKKVFSKKLIWIILVLFLILDIVKVGILYHDTVGTDTLADGRQAVINEIKGPIISENLSFVIEKKSQLDTMVADQTFQTDYDNSTYSGYQFGDSIIFNEIYDELDYAYHYPNLLQKIKTKAEENLILYSNNSYETKKAQKILDTYGDRQIVNYYDTTGYEVYFSYDFSTLLVLLFLLFTLTPIFAEESEVKMDLLILSTPNGRKPITKAKLSAAVTITLGSTLLFLLLDLLLFFTLFPLEGGENPLYSLQSFAYTTFNGSIIQYAILSICLKLIGSIFFSLLYLLFSSVFTTVLPAIIGSGSVLFLLIFGNDFIPINWLRQISPLSLFINRTLFQAFTQINCFQNPIDSIYLLLGVVIVLSVIMLFLILLLQGRNRISKQSIRAGEKRYENVFNRTQ